MAKKEFTDIAIRICEKDYHFKRVTNETLTMFSEKAEKEFEENIKPFIDEFEKLNDEKENLEKRIARLEKQVDIIESKSDASDDEWNKAFELINDINSYEDKLDKVKVKLLKLDEGSPVKEFTKKTDDLLAEKVEMLLDGITAKEFLSNSDPVDTIKARNLEKYYQLCIVGERESKIKQEMRDDVSEFLQTQKGIRTNG